MGQTIRAQLTAVLGPTNTGKTHLAVERLCAHSSGIMGFPLRLLAREVYDRVVRIKGEKQVGLITGEEKILPPDARWLLCTAESMPVERDVAFVALDEAQLGADLERGHVFTDRLLRARGREETMILGSESLTPMVRALAPDAEIISRPRFSQLSYAGPKKLSRLPPRTAIVAFSAEHVYAVAEMLRRTRGGAAVVMGALSPATRNAQVAMYQAGEVDYLVATDAIGMGLNMDVGHVAFASLTKFDGKKQRRLTLPEMAQIAGRAGRHQRDGSFGVLAGGPDSAEFSEQDIERIEEHRFSPMDHLLWRNTDLDFGSIDDLIGSLEVKPDSDVLRAAPEAIDLAVLKILANEAMVRDRARRPALVARLWSACGLPDFRKVGAEHHGRLVTQLFGFLSEGNGHIPADWLAKEITRLESIQGDVETVAARIAAVRTWAYVAHRADWLADPAHWAEKTRALELKLSDALHQKLTERFVDRRTSVLMRSIGADPALLDVEVDDEGSVRVEGELIGSLSGFRFTPDAAARGQDHKRLLAAAELRLPRELARRAARLADAPDQSFTLDTLPGAPVEVLWSGLALGRLRPGKGLLSPRFEPDAAIARLEPALRQQIVARVDRWVSTMIAQRLAPLQRAQRLAADPATPAALRGILAQLVDQAGVLARAGVDDALATLDRKDRPGLARLGLAIGTLDLFWPALLKPEPTRLRLALHAVRSGTAMPPVPLPGLGLLDKPAAELARGAQLAGFRRFGDQMLRIDLVEKIARTAHDARGKERLAEIDPALAISLGVGSATYARIMRALGFMPANADQPHHWRWRGRPRRAPAPVAPVNAAFAALADWKH
ncbi:MAG: helicase-related protein [Chakrabartia sp.]